MGQIMVRTVAVVLLLLIGAEVSADDFDVLMKMARNHFSVRDQFGTSWDTLGTNRKPGARAIRVNFDTKRLTSAELKRLSALDQLQVLGLFSCAIIDDDLKGLAAAGLKNLKTLYLNETQKITDDCMKSLGKLESLEELSFYKTKITGVGFKELAGLKKLKILVLARSKVSDAGLKDLSVLENLEDLQLNDTVVSDPSMKRIAGLKELRILQLTRTKFGDEGLKDLASLKKLQKLYMNQTYVTDAGLKYLAGLDELQVLQLGGGTNEENTNFTDAGLKVLGGLKLKELRQLVITGRNPKITDAGLKELRKALPKCSIIR
jgi:internalin A